MRNAWLLWAVASLSCLSAPVWSMETPPSLKLGDAAFRERASVPRAKESLEIYRALHKENPRDPEVAWRLSMACYFVGLRLTPDGEREGIFAEGRDAGIKAMEENPDCAPCHFWTAVNMALYGKEAGIFKTLSSLGEIREHLKTAQKIDPAYAQGGAPRILGAIEENLPGILGGSDEAARSYYEKAIALAPDEPLNYLFLAKLLLKKGEGRAMALQLVRKGASIPIRDPSRLESMEAQAELKELLAR